MNNAQLDIQFLPGAGARVTMILMHVDKVSNHFGSYDHLLKDEEVPETMDFDQLEKLIASGNSGNPTVYGYRLATSIVADFLVEGKPVTLSNVVKKEEKFTYVGGKMIERATLLGHCQGDLAKLAKKFPDTSEYILTAAGILPFHKNIHTIMVRPVKGGGY